MTSSASPYVVLCARDFFLQDVLTNKILSGNIITCGIILLLQINNFLEVKCLL